MKVYCESKLSRLRNKLIHLTSFNGFCKIRHFQQCPQQLKSGKQIKNWLHTHRSKRNTQSQINELIMNPFGSSHNSNLNATTFFKKIVTLLADAGLLTGKQTKT